MKLLTLVAACLAAAYLFRGVPAIYLWLPAFVLTLAGYLGLSFIAHQLIADDRPEDI